MGKYPWEVPGWEKDFGKMPNNKTDWEEGGGPISVFQEKINVYLDTDSSHTHKQNEKELTFICLDRSKHFLIGLRF